MNNPHQNARLTVYNREQIVARVADGQTAVEVAASFGVSVRTVRKRVARYRARYRQGGRAALANRASAPARLARRLPERVVAVIGWMRRALRLTAGAIAGKLGLPRSTVARWLARAGLGKLAALEPPVPARRYQRDRPGELIHLDIKKLGRFDRPGHRGGGDSAYRSRRFGKALRWLGVRHIHTRPYTPKTNGKAERFIQTLLREWAYGLTHPSSKARNADRPRWLDWFNRSRPHSAINGLPPLSVMNNLMRIHS